MGIEERRERERGERRDLILQSAVQVYSQEGYHATTMEKVAQQAELSRATLYLYFKTKEELFVEAIVSCTDYFGDVLEDIYDRELRNAIFHSDFTLHRGELRLRHRGIRVIGHDERQNIINRAVAYLASIKLLLEFHKKQCPKSTP